MAIDSEVVDRHVIHTQEVCTYNTCTSNTASFSCLKTFITDGECTANSLHRYARVVVIVSGIGCRINDLQKWYNIRPCHFNFLFLGFSGSLFG